MYPVYCRLLSWSRSYVNVCLWTPDIWPLTSTCVSEPLTYDHFNMCLWTPDIWPLTSTCVSEPLTWPLQCVSLKPWHMTTSTCVSESLTYDHLLRRVSLNPWHMTTSTCVSESLTYDHFNMCLWIPDIWPFQWFLCFPLLVLYMILLQIVTLFTAQNNEPWVGFYCWVSGQ